VVNNISYRYIPIDIMTIHPDMFPVVNPDRMTTFRRAKEWVNQQEDWGED
jgi:hypothetical protein